ncbi:hypothetical protein BGZ83_005872 [Gryganskiella cystojenkinii]|nr:hypothetical protein BGZ83_005872 [Gryganskiella cystojenkinii]
MDSPTVNQQTFSPSRLQRQVQATSAVRNHLPSPVLPLASPSKRMRPVSELPRKLAPAFSSVSSPTAKGVSVAVAAPSSSAANGTDLASPERPTPISPTRKLTEIARTLQRPAGSDLRKPAPLGPKLSKIAEEIRIEQEDKKMQHRQAKEEKISDSHADYIREQKKKARERQSSPSMGLRAESMSTGYGDFYLSSPIEDNDKNKERSTDKDLMPRYLSSSSSSSSRAGYLQRSESPQEEPPSFVYNTEDLKPRSRPVGVYSSQEQEQEKSPPPQQQRQENAFENEEREARERKKQELLSEVQAMRKQTTVMPPPSVSLRPRSAAAPATSTASVTTTNQTQVPPLAPPSTPVGNQGYVGENPDLQMKDYRNKISGNSSGWSKMSRVDGTVLARYKGPRNLVANSTIIESRLRVFSEKRRVLALDLLDPDKGIARPSSFYLSAPMSLLDQLLQHHQDQEQEQELQQRQGQQQGRPGSKSTAPSRATGTATTSGSNNDVARLPALVNSISTTAATSALPSSRATTSTTAPSAATVITAPLTTSSTISLIRPAMTKAIPPTAGITGTSIRASVVYRMLIIPNDESAGWEVGAVMSNGRFVRVQSTLNTSAWIQNAAPGRLLKFFGQFVKQSDGSTIFSLDGATRNPDSLAESGWGNAVKNIELKKFPSIQSLREHRYMGDAVLEETTILTVDFPDLTDNYNVDDLDPDAMLSFIKCYCRDCTSPAESSPQNPAIFYCPHCHLRQKSSLEWYYPPFQMTLIDLKKKGSQRTKLGATLSTEMLQVRCQLELGDQVFPTVPASEWVGEGDVAKFWRCKESWTEIMANFNSGSDEDTDDNDHDQSTKDHGQRHQYQRNARVEVRVGLNFVAKALAVRYLS